MRPYYQRDGVTLYLGDCAEVLPGLGQVDHCLTDPPYVAKVVRNSRSAMKGNYTSSWSGVMAQPFCYAGLTEDLRTNVSHWIAALTRRWILVFSDVEFSYRWREDLETAGARYMRTCCWVKPGSAPQFTGDRPAQGWEPITVCHGAAGSRWNGGGKAGVYVHPNLRPQQRTYPGQKPEALMRELVRDFTEEGETILDPFAGSGTTLVAAFQCGRKAVGIESREESCEAIAKRLNGELSQGALFSRGVGA